MSYRLPDEPEPGRLASSVVNPVWPLLAVMFGGVWLSWPWLVFNAVALGSPTIKRELRWIGGGMVFLVLYLFAALFLVEVGILPEAAIRYLMLVLTAAKLFVSYMVFTMQGRAFQIHNHFLEGRGLEAKSGASIAFGLGLLGSSFLSLLPRFWQIVLG